MPANRRCHFWSSDCKGGRGGSNQLQSMTVTGVTGLVFGRHPLMLTCNKKTNIDEENIYLLFWTDIIP